MKKTIDYYMKLKYRMEIFQDEEGYALLKEFGLPFKNIKKS